MTKYQERDQHDDCCSHPRCREVSQIRFLTGATVLNPNYGVQLCDKHHLFFCEEMGNYYEKHPEKIKVVSSNGRSSAQDANLEELVSDPVLDAEIEENRTTRAPTAIDLTGMWS